MAVSICAAASSRRARSSGAASCTINWPSCKRSPSCAKIFSTRPLERGPTCASSTSMVPETAFFRSPHDERKIDNASNTAPHQRLSILIRTNNFIASRIEMTLLQTSTTPVKEFEMAGYSGTPLAQKLGIKPAMTVIAIGAPANYRKLLGKTANKIKLSDRVKDNSIFIHFFTIRRRELEKRLVRLRRKIADAGTL